MTLSLITATLTANSQGTNEAYQILGVPMSSHIAALGGHNISLVDDDASLAFANPALLTSVSDKSLSLGYAKNLAKYGSAVFTRQTGERGNWAIGALYCDYGTIKQTNQDGLIEGEATAKDIVLQGTYAYNLSDYIAGGISTKAICSNYASFSAFAMGVDLGLNYYDEDTELSVSVAMKNIGGQIKRFDDRYESLPTSLQAGLTKRMEHAPLRFSITLTDLNHWSRDYYYKTDGTDDSTGKILIKHLAFGVDILPTDNIYLSLGFNGRRQAEMKIDNSTHGAGWTFGGGISTNRFSFGLAYARLHVASSSLLCNFSLKM